MSKATYPRSMADAIKEIKELRASLAREQEFKGRLISERDDARSRKFHAEEEAKAAREQFSDLKERLHKSEIEVARLRGYMERVREDDAVADPLVEVEGPDGKRFVSKRHPAPVLNYSGDEAYFHDALRSTKSKHWTSY